MSTYQWVLQQISTEVTSYVLKKCLTEEKNSITRILLFSLLSYVWLFATPWTAAYQASLSFTISQSLLKLMFIESVMPSNHLVLCGPLLLLPSIVPSIRVFSKICILGHVQITFISRGAETKFKTHRRLPMSDSKYKKVHLEGYFSRASTTVCISTFLWG